MRGGRPAPPLAIALVGLVGLMSAPLAAQSPPLVRRFELGGGLRWAGGSPAGAATASEVGNHIGEGPDVTLFEADARMRPATGVSARVGYVLTRRIVLEGGVSYSRPAIVTTITSDFEDSPDLSLDASQLHEYLVDVGVVVHLAGLGPGSPTAPFVAARAGYLRQLTDGRTTAEVGRLYEIGGGLKRLMGRRTGLRLDASLGLRDGGFSLDEPRTRAFLAVGAGAFVAF
jgi:hypothetical protein